MSVDTSYVETPKDDASFGELEAIRSAAAASVGTATEVAGEAVVQEAKAAGAAEEGRRAEAGEAEAARSEGAVQASAESRVAQEAVTNALAPGLQVALAGVEALNEERSNPKASVDTASIEKLTGGMVGRQATSFEDGFKKIKSNPNGNLQDSARRIETGDTGRGLFEKAETSASSLRSQGSCVASWKQMQESSQVMQQTRDMALGNRMANEAVYARAVSLQAQQAPQHQQQMALNHGGLGQGPKFKEPKEETGDGSESWATA